MDPDHLGGPPPRRDRSCPRRRFEKWRGSRFAGRSAGRSFGPSPRIGWRALAPSAMYVRGRRAVPRRGRRRSRASTAGLARQAQGRAFRQAGDNRVGRRQILTAAFEPAWQRVHRPARWRVRQAVEHLEILALDDRPPVVIAEELAAVSAERRAQPPVALDRAQCFQELRIGLIVQTGGAADALTLQDIALAVGEHRPSERPRFQRDHRQAFEIRRHDQKIGGRHRVELVGIVQESEVANAGMIGHRQQGVADEEERELARWIAEIALKKFEQLRAALVLVDASDVDGKRVPDVVLLAEPVSPRVLGHLRPDAHDHARHLLIAGYGLDHRPFLIRVVHQGANAAEDRLKHREPDRRIAFGRRHEDGARRRRAHAVVGVIVAIAEEDAVVVAPPRSWRGDRSGPARLDPPRRANRARRRGNAVARTHESSAGRTAADRARVSRETGAPGRR